MSKSYLDSWDDFEKHKNGGLADNSSSHDVVPFKGTAGKGKTKASSSHYVSSVGERCFKSHKPLTLPGSELKIYGGSCCSPSVLDADVYIGFDSGMEMTQKSWPWKKGAEFMFRIPDMGVPASPDEFKKLVSWTRKQLEAGLKVHCGCIGGHGRTGTFLAALCSDFGEKDAIKYVRANYCEKAVESTTQVNFLHEHFGITKVDGYKSSASYTGHKTYATGTKGGATKAAKAGTETFTCMGGNGNIWEARKA